MSSGICDSRSGQTAPEGSQFYFNFSARELSGQLYSFGIWTREAGLGFAESKANNFFTFRTREAGRIYFWRAKRPT